MDMHGETPMSRALKCGHFGVVELMLALEREEAQRRPTEDALLHRAAYWGLERAVRKLLSDGLPTDDPDDAGQTALTKAVRSGHTDSAVALLESGADVNRPSDEGLTNLHWAALSGSQDMARVLIRFGADVNAREHCFGGMTPFALSKMMGYEELSELLVQHGGSW
jgi:ankyrin repeat protein